MKFLLMSTVILMAALSNFAQTNGATKPTASETLAEAKKAIELANIKWAEAWTKGDYAAVAEIFAEDGIFLSSSGRVIKGRPQLLEFYKAAMAGVGKDITELKVTVTTINAWLDGELVYETGKYNYNYLEKGKPAEEKGKYVTIWKKQKDGNWRLVMDMGVPKD